MLSVDQWAPIFAFYGGTTVPKYTDAQIAAIAVSTVDRTWCHLCDASFTGIADEHVSEHMVELREWHQRRSATLTEMSKSRLAAARAKRKASE
jgi:hypothetical protein